MQGGKKILSSVIDNGLYHFKCHPRLGYMSNLQKINNLLQIESDLHLEKKFKRKLNPKKPYLLLAGDIGYPFEKEYKDFILESSFYFNKVFILSGNHEYDFMFHDKVNGVRKTEARIRNICNLRNNLFYLQKDVHTLCSKDNILLAGCTLWSPLPASMTKYHFDHQEWLRNTLENNPQNKYVVATHHCPLLECLNRKYHSRTPNYFASEQSDLIQKDNLICWIHGHSHNNKDINVYDKWIISNQYGSYEDPLWGYKN